TRHTPDVPKTRMQCPGIGYIGVHHPTPTEERSSCDAESTPSSAPDCSAPDCSPPPRRPEPHRPNRASSARPTPTSAPARPPEPRPCPCPPSATASAQVWCAQSASPPSTGRCGSTPRPPG